MIALRDSLLEYFKGEGIEYAENLNVASRSTFKVGGKAKLSVFPRSREKLIKALVALDEEGMRAEVIGNASNLLFAFDFFQGALVFTDRVCELSREGECLLADCGALLTRLSKLAADSSLSGFEFAYGIPGLVGGSVYMNAGAYGAQMSDVLEYSEAYDRESGQTIRIYDHGFAYRQSVYMTRPSLVCLGARFRLKKGNVEDIKARMAENMSSRRDNQPLEFPSAGSYFKRPEGYFAGKLIEDCGLKGMRVGGAEVSQKHAGFIINRGDATWGDVLTLEEKIKEIVMSRFGVELEREVRLIK